MYESSWAKRPRAALCLPKAIGEKAGDRAKGGEEDKGFRNGGYCCSIHIFLIESVYHEKDNDIRCFGT